MVFVSAEKHAAPPHTARSAPGGSRQREGMRAVRGKPVGNTRGMTRDTDSPRQDSREWPQEKPPRAHSAPRE